MTGLSGEIAELFANSLQIFAAEIEFECDRENRKNQESCAPRSGATNKTTQGEKQQNQFDDHWELLSKSASMLEQSGGPVLHLFSPCKFSLKHRSVHIGSGFHEW